MDHFNFGIKPIAVPIPLQLNRAQVLEVFKRFGAMNPVIFERSGDGVDEHVSIAYSTITKLSKEQITALEIAVFNECGITIEACDVTDINALYREYILSNSRAI